MSLLDRLKKGWNAFLSTETNPYVIEPKEYMNYGSGYSTRPYYNRLAPGNERSIVTAVYNRIAVDCSLLDFCHAKLDEKNRFENVVDSGLNNCLTVEANKDQTGRALILDATLSLLDEGVIALCPIDTDKNINNGSFDILSLRVCKITQWFPDHIQVEAYNDRTGQKSQLMFPKSEVAIIENPFYSVMNAPNSTLQRLIRKLNILDAIDEQSGSGKLDLIIQLPYVVKTDTRRKEAEKRRTDIEQQLNSSKYGIAYIDGTEKITQLNRSVENNLMKQIEYLTSMLYSQLNMSQKILDGTASEQELLFYYHHTIEAVANAICDEMNRKFLTKTARTQKQKIIFFDDPFKLVPMNSLAELADKFTRNEIMSSNEFRQILGLKPVNTPEADSLRNKNITPGKTIDYQGDPAVEEKKQVGQQVTEERIVKEKNQNGEEV